MSGLNTLLVPLGQIQEQFWDKLTDAPLAGGVLYFWSDPQCSVPKLVYRLTGVPPDFTYTPFGTSVTLSSIGTTDDGMGNNFTPYLYPYSDTILDGSGTIQLYYITVYNAEGQYQFTTQGVPNAPAGSSPTPTGGTNTNFIPNGQFLLHNTIAGAGLITAASTNVAYGGWQFIKTAPGADDYVTFERFGSPITSPSGNPRYSCRVKCTSPISDTSKVLQIYFKDVNRFSTASGQDMTLFFSGINNLAGDIGITVNLHKDFGSGGSAATDDNIPISGPFTPTFQNFLCYFNFGSNIGKTLGAGDDDYFAIQIVLPPAAIFNIEVTDFVLYIGNVAIDSYPLTTDPLIPTSIPYQNAVLTTDPVGDILWEVSPAENSLLTCDTVGNISWQDTLPANITISPGLVTDPFTSSPATIDTVLLELYNHVLSNQDVYLANPVTLSIATTNYQTVTGMTVTLPAGTYLINYSAFIRLYTDYNMPRLTRAWICLYNTTTPGIVVDTEVVAASINNSEDRVASSGVASVIVTVSVPTTIQMQSSIDLGLGNISLFVVETATITTVCLSSNG